MRGVLAVSKTLRLPKDILTQTTSLLAIKGAGKTHTAKVIVEELLMRHLQVVIIDPVHAWWGLRLDTNGKPHGFDIPIFGGPRADVPLEPGAGGLIAEIVARRGMSCILDISDWRKRDQVRFVAEFTEELYRLKNRIPTPMLLVLEEADLFAPQKLGFEGGTRREHFGARALEAIGDIVRRGRGRGMGTMLITQRSSVLNKDVLYQSETLIILRIIGPGDYDAVNGWVKKHNVKAEVVEVMESLPSLPRGTGWIWSPGWLRLLKRVKFRPLETFDSSATPRVGARAKKVRKLTPVDVQRLRAQMGEMVQRQALRDPIALRNRIRDLEAQLARNRPAEPAAARVEVRERVVTRRVEVPILTKRERRKLDRAMNKLRALSNDVYSIATHIGVVLKKVEAQPAPTPPLPPPVVAQPVVVRRAVPVPRARPVEAQTGALGRGERSVMIAIAQYQEIERKRLSVLTGYKQQTRDKYIANLIGRGFVELRGQGVVASTAQGVASLGNFEPLPTGPALLNWWRERLPRGERQVLESCIASAPHPVERTAITNQTGYKQQTRDKYLSNLVARQLVEITAPGQVRVTPTLVEA